MRVYLSIICLFISFNVLTVLASTKQKNGGSGNKSITLTGNKFVPLTKNGNTNRTLLTFDYLTSFHQNTNLIDMSAFALPTEAAPPSNTFEGTLILYNEATSGKFSAIKDQYQYINNTDSARKHLPEFSYQFVQSGSHIIPVKRGMLDNSHPYWEYILEPGRVWDEQGDSGYSRVAIPFSLQEKNANCIHNGIMTFAFKNDGSITQLAYQIASETCLYFQFDMWGLLQASYIYEEIPNKKHLIESYQNEVKNRLPSKAISQLPVDFPNADIAALNKSISADHMSLFGLFIAGVNYVGGCDTRQGSYPYCDVLRVPSYSTAKSNFAGVGLMRLEHILGNIFNQTIDKYIPECAESGLWKDVTFEHTVDMTTGNFDSKQYMSDEYSPRSNKLFIPLDHQSKIQFACNAYSRKAKPGNEWVYHTSDTYILGTAMNAIIRKNINVDADIFNDLMVEELWRPLSISRSTLSTRRTYDESKQAFAGWGLTYNTDDVVKLAKFLSIDKGKIDGHQMLDPTELNAALQKDTKDRGLKPANKLAYKNGFWAKDLSSETGCNDMWVPFMSGYGGITVALFPNDTIYYYFSDNDEFSWVAAALESHELRSFCAGSTKLSD